MIKLKNLLTEKYIKTSLSKIKGITFLVTANENLLVFIPKTSKDLDLVAETGYQKHEVQQALSGLAQDKTKLIFTPNFTYPGAGYAITLDMDAVIKKL